jgi:predicted aminopeptidase
VTKISGKKRWLRRSALAAVLLLIVVAFSGCQTFSFYRQAIKGQYQLFAHQQKVEKLIADPKTPEALRTQLKLVQELRSFADQQLKLPVDGHYRKYVDVHRPYVVWNVEAAPEFSMAPKGWWYPLVGRLEYRGYFTEKGARDYARILKQKGFDVQVGGVTAYSTLGWFKDPLLNTFVFDPEADLAETIFHELGHQRVFARGDTAFNEAFATTVGQEGARRWLQSRTNSTAMTNYAAELKRTREFALLIAKTRTRLEALYGDERTDDGKIKSAEKKPDIPPDTLRRRKKEILDQLQSDYLILKREWGGDPDYDGWFAREVNNAKLNAVAAYYDLVPGFEHLLALNGGDLEKFYTAAQRLSVQPKKDRQQWLRTLGSLESIGKK